MNKYDIGAYIWPAYTGDDDRSRIFWEEGIGEWQTVKNQEPKPGGYFWNRKPLWGYVNEADRYVMSMQIEAAVSHGVNVFIYDWYWYDGRPFLENCLDEGFLKAPNRSKIKFYIMWANHNANHLWDRRNADIIDFGVNVWNGAVDRKQFEIIGRRWIDMYFKQDNYYKIDGKPVVSIYDLDNLIAGLGGAEQTKLALDWLREEAVQAGFPGVHFQFINYGKNTRNLSGVDGHSNESTAKLAEYLGFDSLTNYQFVHFTDIDRDYEQITADAVKEWDAISREYSIPYFPHVSVGWDNNPRFKSFREGIVKNNTPENFEKTLRLAKAEADKHNVKLITVNSWNEWTETSYLEPDNVYGYGYLEAIKRVFTDDE